MTGQWILRPSALAAVGPARQIDLFCAAIAITPREMQVAPNADSCARSGRSRTSPELDGGISQQVPTWVKLVSTSSVLLAFTVRACHSGGDQGLVVGALGDVLVGAGQAAFDEVQGSLHLRYSQDQLITVAAGDFSALFEVGGRQDVADVGQGEPCLLGEQDARDPVEVGAGVSAATSGRARARAGSWSPNGAVRALPGRSAQRPRRCSWWRLTSC
jgi:hypothetical protein